MLLLAPDEAPAQLTTSTFTTSPLTLDNLELDYAAYMASPDVIRIHSDGRWPVDGFSLSEDRDLVEVHQADHRAGRAFTFLLLTPDGTESLGCLYLNPLHGYLDRVDAPADVHELFPGTSAMVTFWLRQDLQKGDLPTAVVTAVDSWLRSDWPIDRSVWRILPGEESSRIALRAAGLQETELTLPGEQRPYLRFSR